RRRRRSRAISGWPNGASPEGSAPPEGSPPPEGRPAPSLPRPSPAVWPASLLRTVEARSRRCRGERALKAAGIRARSGRSRAPRPAGPPAAPPQPGLPRIEDDRDARPPATGDADDVAPAQGLQGPQCLGPAGGRPLPGGRPLQVRQLPAEPRVFGEVAAVAAHRQLRQRLPAAL